MAFRIGTEKVLSSWYIMPCEDFLAYEAGFRNYWFLHHGSVKFSETRLAQSISVL